MHNVIIVKMDQSICNLQRNFLALGISDSAGIAEDQLIKTSTTAELEHNARVRSVKTDSIRSNEVRVWRNAECQFGFSNKSINISDCIVHFDSCLCSLPLAENEYVRMFLKLARCLIMTRVIKT